LEENLAIITDSISFLQSRGRRVFFDAEHFFDGFKANTSYALQTLRAAAQAGAECAILCDTNGGTLPSEIARILAVVRGELGIPLGIHTHNDGDTAVAGTLAAVENGVTHVQGTVNGYGERCGNANLLSIIANLKLKMGMDCITDGQLERLTEVSRFMAETVNLPPASSQPFVGASAFAHKGGLHASAVVKLEESYQHVHPSTIGNVKRVVVSELAGRGNILYRSASLALTLS
jgi:2-isopropylmalate synthase